MTEIALVARAHAAILLALALAGCRGEPVAIRITGEHWQSDVSSPAGPRSSPLPPSTVRVGRGERFGGAPWSGVFAIEADPFQILAIEGPGRVRIRFAEGLVPVGEPISGRGGGTALLTAQPSCFRTCTYDAGIDVCLALAR